MLHLTPAFAAVFGFGSAELFGFLIPVVAIVAGGVITVSSMYFKHERRKLWHETARLALEKGQPVPSAGADLRPPRGIEREPAGDIPVAHDIRGGMVLIAVGIGLWLMMGQIADQLRFVGAIPGFIGIALLLFGLGRVMFGRKSSDQHGRPPQT